MQGRWTCIATEELNLAFSHRHGQQTLLPPVHNANGIPWAGLLKPNVANFEMQLATARKSFCSLRILRRVSRAQVEYTLSIYTDVESHARVSGPVKCAKLVLPKQASLSKEPRLVLGRYANSSTHARLIIDHSQPSLFSVQSHY